MRCGKELAHYENSTQMFTIMIFFNSTAFFPAQSLIIWTTVAALQLIFLSTGSCLILSNNILLIPIESIFKDNTLHHTISLIRNPRFLLKILPTTCRIVKIPKLTLDNHNLATTYHPLFPSNALQIVHTQSKQLV